MSRGQQRTRNPIEQVLNWLLVQLTECIHTSNELTQVKLHCAKNVLIVTINDSQDMVQLSVKSISVLNIHRIVLRTILAVLHNYLRSIMVNFRLRLPFDTRILLPSHIMADWGQTNNISCTTGTWTADNWARLNWDSNPLPDMNTPSIMLYASQWFYNNFCTHSHTPSHQIQAALLGLGSQSQFLLFRFPSFHNYPESLVA